MATAETAAEAEAKTYWCHECDMSVSLTLPPSPLLCPHCHTHFLELMDSPLSLSQNDAESPLFDVVFQDALLLLNPPPLPSSKPRPLPSLHVTPSLLSSLDPNGVVLCAVCKDQIAPDTEAKAKQLPCKHLYHADCITPWIELHASCPLCRFRLEDDDEEEGDGVMTEIRRELIARLTELTEEDFYGLRTTLSHIASRHALIEENENRAPVGEPRGGDSAC